MYFAILGKHPQISLTELQIVEPKIIPSTKKDIILFETEKPELLKTLWWCIKSGRVVREKDLQTQLAEISILGVQEDTIGKHLKKTIGIRRFKLVKINHTDKEIKEKGKEIINLTRGDFGIVDHYQNIPLYEAIDFEKPGRSMQMGMMPAKLAHIMITIGIKNASKENAGVLSEKISIYDPFVGSGTTCFLANYLGYNTIGSDIKISYAQQNLTRRLTTAFANKSKSIDFFSADACKISSKEHILYITEGRLGPIITKKSTQHDVEWAQAQVLTLYKSFLENLLQDKKEKVMVFTIPHYFWHQNTLERKLQGMTTILGYQRSSIAEIYAREDQQVGRQICIITQKKQ